MKINMSLYLKTFLLNYIKLSKLKLMGNCVKRETGLEFRENSSFAFDPVKVRIMKMKLRMKSFLGVQETEKTEEEED